MESEGIKEVVNIPDFKGLEFTEQGHVYRVDGYTVPSVSRIMKPLSGSYYEDIDKETLAKAAQKGTDIHASVENYLLYQIEDVKSELRCYFDGMKAWIDQQTLIPIRTELKLYHSTMRYAGRCDLLCELGGKLALVDFKTTQKIATSMTRIQLEAYRQAFISHGLDIDRKLILQCYKDGKYHVEEYDKEDREAWKIFTELLDVYRYQQKYKK